MTDMKRIREALCLFKSMVDCGERASQTSSEAFENAMGDSLAVDAELTALRNRYSTECEWCGGEECHGQGENGPCPRCGDTGRVMMLDAEEVKAKKKDVKDEDWYDGWNFAMDTILEGKR